jgi:hypothetical protein
LITRATQNLRGLLLKSTLQTVAYAREILLERPRKKNDENRKKCYAMDGHPLGIARIFDEHESSRRGKGIC